MSQRLPDPKELGRLFAIGQIGMEMVVPIALGAAIDYWRDWTPWSTVSGAVIGFIIGLVHLVRLTNQPDRDDTANKPEQGPS